jgi:arabinan endo-1,5-alpha-L-arabinosidase
VLRNLLSLFVAAASAVAANVEPLEGDLFVHDPSTILKDGTNYHLFSTGAGSATKSSSNRLHWTRGQSVFASPPAWTTNVVPGFRGYFWAPDVAFVDGRYLLYYSVSTFGKQLSAIGLATGPTLDTASLQYHWTDHGAVLQSRAGDAFNAIDPSVMLDRDGKLWMAFGSFWRGIYLAELDPRTGKRIAPDSPLHRLAWHESIEAAGLYRHRDDYYLFVNWGACCRGTNSTYEVRVGRSKGVTGPFLDRDRRNLVDRGGTPFLQSEGQDIGPGHVGVLNDNGREFISYHVYDARLRGRSQLRIRSLRWSPDGWPVAAD